MSKLTFFRRPRSSSARWTLLFLALTVSTAPTATATPTAAPGTFGNISTRLRVETGENVLIGGFIVTGTQPKKVIVRAIGPSLPLAGVLADPILELRDSSGSLIRSNDNWRSDQEAEIIARPRSRRPTIWNRPSWRRCRPTTPLTPRSSAG